MQISISSAYKLTNGLLKTFWWWWVVGRGVGGAKARVSNDPSSISCWLKQLIDYTIAPAVHKRRSWDNCGTAVNTLNLLISNWRRSLTDADINCYKVHLDFRPHSTTHTKNERYINLKPVDKMPNFSFE